MRTYTRRQALKFGGLSLTLSPFLLLQACDEVDQAVEEAKGVATTVSEAAFSLSVCPVPTDKVTSANWYGNTELAYTKRREWYAELQGFHSGVDWLLPVRSQVISGVVGNGTVLSVDGKPAPNAWGSEPNAVAVQYRDFIVLYGHLSEARVTPGMEVRRDTVLGLSGTGQGTPHLHLEVIRRDKNTSAGQRPGSVRTNPVKYFSPALLQFTTEMAKGSTFHANSKNEWLKPSEQPDITPGKTHYFP